MASQSSSFANEKVLKFVITLGIGRGSFQGPFVDDEDAGNYQTLTLQRLRASVHVSKAGGMMLSTLDAQIYGMTLSDMNSVTTTQWDALAIAGGPTLAPNTITVYAVDGQQETLIFSGNIINAWGVYSGIPENYLMVQAVTGYAAKLQAPSDTSFNANTTVGTAMQKLAAQAGLTFQNNGVDLTVKSGTYLAGSPLEQMQALMRAHRFWMAIDDNGTVVITPANVGVQPTTIAPLVSAETGLISYPIFNGVGVLFETLFNPAITFLGTVEIQSQVQRANGTWVVASMAHDLESQTPGGSWKSTVNCTFPQATGQVLATEDL